MPSAVLGTREAETSPGGLYFLRRGGLIPGRSPQKAETPGMTIRP